MSNEPKAESRGHRQLTMLLPISGNGFRSVRAQARSEDDIRKAVLEQLEKSGLRRRGNED